MPTTQYIGSRYVPLLADPVEWSAEKEYEPLTIVTHEGNSYTSRQFVPKGIDITNGQFWAMTGNYNAQVEQYRRETQQAVAQIEDWYDTAVAEYANKYAAKPFVFDTVSDMQNARELLYVGAFCYTNGFYSRGDNGGACYVISESGEANNMDVIACGATFRANLIVIKEVTPEMVGAYGDGVTDDLARLQTIMKYDHIVFKANATYALQYMTASDYLNCHSGMMVDLNGATIKLLPHELNSHRIFNIGNDTETIKNVTIANGTIYGEKLTHVPVAGQQGGYAIRVGRNAKNITLENLFIADMYGDGMYIGTGNESNNDIPEFVTINNCKIDNTRRNGISVTNGINVSIDDVYIANTSGQTPLSGIDFEPNWASDVIKAHVGSIVVENQSGVVTVSNYSGAILDVLVDNVYGKNISEMYIRLDTPSNVYMGNVTLLQKQDATSGIVLDCQTSGAKPYIDFLRIKQSAIAANRPIIGLQSNDSQLELGTLEIIDSLTFSGLVTNRPCQINIGTLKTNGNKIVSAFPEASVSIGKIMSVPVIITDANATDFFGLQNVIYSPDISEQRRISINGNLHSDLDKITFINLHSTIPARVTFSNSTAPDGTTNFYIPVNSVATLCYVKSIGKWVEV